MKTVIIGDGLLGSEMKLQTGWDVVSRKQTGFDVTNKACYCQLAPYEQVVNCTGYTNTRNMDKEPAWSVNYLAVINLVNYCNASGKKLVHISTDYIYANSVCNASERDIPIHYDNWYTYTKVLADAYVEAMCNNFLTFRASFKPNPFPWDNAWYGLQGNYDYVDVITALFVRLIKGGAVGIYNVGTERKNMFQLAVRTKPDCGVSDNRVMPFDITMDLSKLQKFLDESNNL